MRINLFVPCLAEDFLPEVAEATAMVLARAGCDVAVPKGQTCCGQPLYKTGDAAGAAGLARRFLDIFDQEPGPVVSPSGSCVAMIRKVYPTLLADDPAYRSRAEAVAGRVYELSEFLVDVLGVADLGASLSGRAAYHDSCQVGRALGIRSQPRALLAHVRCLDVAELSRPEDCCGFGGAFSLAFPEVSGAILDQKIDDILDTGADMVVTAELSCLMHIRAGLEGRGVPVKALHIAQVLAGEA